MASMMEEVLNAKISRRDFLKGTAAATAAVVDLGMVGHENSLASAEGVAPAEHPVIADQEQGGTWVPAACWHNCGGRCINLALVKEYLDKYCVGFDREHMPKADQADFEYQPLERVAFTYKTKEIDPDDNFYDYVMGEGKWTAEGAKTPEWASEICGVPAETIKELAVKYATTKPACIYTGGAPARHHNGECFPHALLTLGLVCGQIGRDGASVAAVMEHYGSFGGADLVSQGGAGDANNMPANPFPQKTHALNNAEMRTAILEGARTDHKDAATGEVVMYPVDIHMIHQSFGGALNQRQGMTQGIKAYKKVDFALCINYVLNTSAKYSDIVLPCTTEWERPGALKNNRELLSVGRKIIEPLYEAKSDRDIARGIADKLHELYP